ncbi:MAG: GHKL domain-containing protein [Lachnospiraceae bacterium]|nr:GHKL domain-containing protein [Lachnospiraceae bacterium]
MDIMYRLLDAIAVVIEVVMCFVFVTTFMKENKTRSHFILPLVTVFLNVAVGYIKIPVQVYSAFRIILFISTGLLAQFLIYRNGYGRILLLIVIYIFVLSLIDYSTVAVMAYLSGVEFIYFQKIESFRVYGTIISKGFLLAFVIFIKKKMQGLKMLEKIHLIFLSAISGFITFLAFCIFQNFMQRNQIPGSETTMFLLLLLIEILSFYSFSAMLENKEKEKRLDLLSLYNNILQKSLEEEKFSFGLWSGRVHDYKNHVVYMQELLETKEYEKLKKYMQEETGSFKYQPDYIQSGYRGIDVIVSSKKTCAKSQGIHMYCNIRLPAGLPLDEVAMVTILGNLLDNAIRAEMSSGRKFIEIDINYMKENIYIKIVNHKQPGEINFETSSKENRTWHGIGLRSVKQQVKKLNGDFKLIQQPDKVIAMVVVYEVKNHMENN